MKNGKIRVIIPQEYSEKGITIYNLMMNMNDKADNVCIMNISYSRSSSIQSRRKNSIRTWKTRLNVKNSQKFDK